jgi:transposase
MRKVALDLGAKKTTYCEIADGRVVQRTTVTHVESLEPLLGPEQPPATVAIEACREAWYVHDLLVSWGNQVLLVDTTRSKQLGVGRHGRKTDRIDAEVLARAVEEGRIPLAHVLTPERRKLRKLLNVRRYLVEARAQGVTTARGLARESGVKLSNCDSANFATHVRKRMTTEPQLQVVEPLLMTLDVLTEQLANVEVELARLLAAEPIIQKLSTVPGVGPIVAAVFVSVVDDAKRFHRAHQLESYLGLVPGENSSGGKRRIGAITKKGNPYLRAMLVQASWSLARTASADDPLRVWFEAVAERRGKRIAVVALARKLAGVLWALWRKDTVYDPQSHCQHAARGLRSHAEQISFRRMPSRKQRASGFAPRPSGRQLNRTDQPARQR